MKYKTLARINGEKTEKMFIEKFNKDFNLKQVSYDYADYITDDNILFEVKRSYINRKNRYVKIEREKLKKMIDNKVILAVFVPDLNIWKFYYCNTLKYIFDYANKKFLKSVNFKICL